MLPKCDLPVNVGSRAFHRTSEVGEAIEHILGRGVGYLMAFAAGDRALHWS